MITQRILPEEEWKRLEGTEAEALWPHLQSSTARVIVVEEDGKIVATWTMMRVVHAECLWVAPSHRGSFGVAKRLFKGLRDVAREWGVFNVVTGSVSPVVTDLIRRFGGYPMPCESFILPVNGRLSGKPTLAKAERALGSYFHAQIAVLIPEDVHPDDPEHDERVGRALLTAVKEQAPEKAEQEYNSWAESAGYEPVKYLGMVNGRMRADIRTAVVEVDGDFVVSVVEGECR